VTPIDAFYCTFKGKLIQPAVPYRELIHELSQPPHERWRHWLEGREKKRQKALYQGHRFFTRSHTADGNLGRKRTSVQTCLKNTRERWQLLAPVRSVYRHLQNLERLGVEQLLVATQIGSWSLEERPNIRNGDSMRNFPIWPHKYRR